MPSSQFLRGARLFHNTPFPPLHSRNYPCVRRPMKGIYVMPTYAMPFSPSHQSHLGDYVHSLTGALLTSRSTWSDQFLLTLTLYKLSLANMFWLFAIEHNLVASVVPSLLTWRMLVRTCLVRALWVLAHHRIMPVLAALLCAVGAVLTRPIRWVLERATRLLAIWAEFAWHGRLILLLLGR